VIEKKFGAPIITKDGVTVAKGNRNSAIHSEHGRAEWRPRSRFQDFRRAGDGHDHRDRARPQAIFRECVKTVAAGASPTALKRGSKKAPSEVGRCESRGFTRRQGAT